MFGQPLKYNNSIFIYVPPFFLSMTFPLYGPAFFTASTIASSVTDSSAVSHAFSFSKDTFTSLTLLIPSRDFLTAIGQRLQDIPCISIITFCSAASAYIEADRSIVIIIMTTTCLIISSSS